MAHLFEIVQHLPDYLRLWAGEYGRGLYFLIGAIIFAETGLVVTPLLPGDSLLFATGAVLALKFPGLDVTTMLLVLVASAFAGDLVNYHVGRWAAPRLFSGGSSKWLNRRHLDRTQEFYTRHGGRTVIIARFVPIVRTYAPFVAGLAGMPRPRFMAFSFTAAWLWIGSFLLLGYFFGNLPSVKANFHYAIAAILLISIAPILVEFLKSKRSN